MILSDTGIKISRLVAKQVGVSGQSQADYVFQQHCQGFTQLEPLVLDLEQLDVGLPRPTHHKHGHNAGTSRPAGQELYALP